MDPITNQLTRELTSRLGVIGLLDQDLAYTILEQVIPAAAEWARILADPHTVARRAPDLMVALWPDGVPLEWWGTPVGLLIADSGFDPGGVVSATDASDMLGWSRPTCRKYLGSPPHEVRAVLNELVAAPV